MIWLACARIAASLASIHPPPSISAAMASSGDPIGGGSASGSKPAKVSVSPTSRSRLIPAIIREALMVVQSTRWMVHGSPRSDRYDGTPASRYPYIATRWAWMWSG